MSESVPAHVVVAVWERGRREHPVDRALTLLAALSGRPRHELTDLSVEQRDRLILAWRARLLGRPPVGWAECRACGCGVEVTLGLPEGWGGTDGPEPGGDLSPCIDVDGQRVPVRLPTSADLAAAAGAEDPESARAVLARRALSAAPDPDALAARADVLALLDDALERCAEVSGASASLECPDCATTWDVALDAAAFTWREIEILAARLLREVDVLARRYGWSEAEILGLSADRRHFYLELAA